MRIYRVLNLTFLLILCSFVYGQQNDINNNARIIERIQLKTDRDLYFYGEDILFTADYFLNNEKSYPVLSNKLYVELIESTSNTPAIQKKYKIVNFKVNGQFHIPMDIVSGSYLLRAYTPNQRNFSVFNSSSQYITIINPNNSKLQQSFSGSPDSIYIGVEGKILLDNVRNTVVIKLPGSLIADGNRYLIVDENKKMVKELIPKTSDFIKTEMTFLKSKQYKLEIIKSTGDTLFKELPGVQSTGIQTSTRITPGNVYYKIRTKGVIGTNEKPDFQIKILTNDHTIRYSEEISLSKDSIDKILPSNLFGNGINYILLTDKDGNVKKVNSLFKPPHITAIDIELDKDHFKPREKIAVSVVTKNKIESKFPLAYVSVTRAGTRKEDHGLAPDLYLNNPIVLENYLNSYLQIDEELRNQIMILFDQSINKELFDAKTGDDGQGKSTEFIPKLRDNNITGILRNKDTKELCINYTIYLVILSNSQQIHVTNTKEDGKFIFSVNNVYERNDIFLCYESHNEVEESAHEILVKSPFSTDYPPVSSTIFIDSEDEELIKELYMNAQIQQKFHKKKDNQLTKQNHLRPFNIKGNITTINPDNYISLVTMQDLFNEIVAGVEVKKDRRKDKFVFKVIAENGKVLPGNPLILVDHIPIFDPNSILELDPSHIEKVEVIYETYILDAYPFDGVIMITTKAGDFSEVELPKSAIFTEYQALELPGINPKVDQHYSDSSDRIPDFRTTLYWDPQIILTNNKQTINFNASDRRGEYNIIVEGYDSEGHFYYGKKLITIE